MIEQYPFVIETREGLTITDLTPKLSELITTTKLMHGISIVYVQHTTAGLCINENEPGLLKDMQNFLHHLVPAENMYAHDDLEKRDVPTDEPKNAHAHLKSLFLKTSECIPFANKKLLLGKWQRIFCIDSDGPRERNIYITLMGNSNQCMKGGNEYP